MKYYLIILVELYYDEIGNCQTFIFDNKKLAQEEFEKSQHIGQVFWQEINLSKDLNIGNLNVITYFQLFHDLITGKTGVQKQYILGQIPKGKVPTVRTNGQLTSPHIIINDVSPQLCQFRLEIFLQSLSEQTGGICHIHSVFDDKMEKAGIPHTSMLVANKAIKNNVYEMDYLGKHYKFDISNKIITKTETKIELKPEYKKQFSNMPIPSGCPHMIREWEEKTEI